MKEQTVKCPVCGDPYKIYPDITNDQSACPSCIAEASTKKSTWQKTIINK